MEQRAPPLLGGVHLENGRLNPFHIRGLGNQ